VSKLKVVDLNNFYFIFHFYFLYSIFRTRIRVKVTRLHYHISVISDNMVIVMVTSHMMHGRM